MSPAQTLHDTDTLVEAALLAFEHAEMVMPGYSAVLTLISPHEMRHAEEAVTSVLTGQDEWTQRAYVVELAGPK